MNIKILLAALLSSLTLGIHVFAGGSDVHIPILESELSDPLKTIISVIWHAITAILLINAIALVYAGFNPDYKKPIILLISAQYFFWAGLFIFYGIKDFASIWTMPQWIAFIIIPILAIAGLRNKNSN